MEGKQIKSIKLHYQGEEISLNYLALSNKQGLPQTLQGDNNNSDLVSGVYEGGLKLWDCSIDLCHFLAANPDLVKGKSILEIGCGIGLPAVFSLIHGGAKEVFFQDYNEEVLNNVTIRAIELNKGEMQDGLNFSMLAGDWSALSQRSELYQRFDVILMSETLYNIQYYDGLTGFIEHCLQQTDGLVIIGTKTYYYGLGGGYFEYLKYLENRKPRYSLSILQKLNDMKSIERLVLKMEKVDEVKQIQSDMQDNLNINDQEMDCDEQQDNNQNNEEAFVLQF